MEQCIPRGQNSPRSSTALHSGAYCNKRTVISCRPLVDPQRAESRQADRRDETKPEAWERGRSNPETKLKLFHILNSHSNLGLSLNFEVAQKKGKNKTERTKNDDDRHHHELNLSLPR
jgi:hypothetical protein